MNEGENIRNIEGLIRFKPGTRTMIVSHRGNFGGGIVENTLEAFELALKSGANIIEADVSRTADGKFVIFHDDLLGRITNLSEPVSEVNMEIIRSLKLKNVIGETSGFNINTLDEFLEHMKNRCLINLDRCWGFLDEVYAKVKQHGMEDQILIKAPVHLEEGVKWLEKHNFEPLFIPMIIDDRYIPYVDKLPQKAKVPIVEIFISNETDEVIGREFIQSIHDRGILVWANALTLNNKITLCAWHDDNTSLLKSPESGWGWLVERGIDIIQTDWPMELNRYLLARKSETSN